MSDQYIALRMDDPGACSKAFEIYGKSYARFRNFTFPVPTRISNFLCLKKNPLWTGWAPYPELTSDHWHSIFEVLTKFNAKLTVAVTACWVERDGSLTPYPKKFSGAAEVLKRGVQAGIIEIANHGLTHCVVGKHLPRLFSSNRTYHREFWDWIPEETHYSNIKIAQKILQDFFETSVITLVPPGNVFTDATIRAANEFGIQIINCKTDRVSDQTPQIFGNSNVYAFHDRDIVINKIGWLKAVLSNLKDKKICQVRELAMIHKQEAPVN
ncbi:MAG: polysaccharide deacetylase family protein [Bdellovibrionota bacterium]